MMRTLLGPLIHPDGSPMSNVTLMLRAQRVNWSAAGLVAKSSEYRWQTDQNGNFVQSVAFGDYQCWIVLPDFGGEQPLGPVAVAAGPAVQLGELIEETRDTSGDLSASPNWATEDWVINQITLGAQPFDVGINEINPGGGQAGQLYRVDAQGNFIEPFTLQLKDFPIGNNQPGGLLWEGVNGEIATLPSTRVVSASTAAKAGETLIVDMNSATGNLNITLPPGFVVWQRPVELVVMSDEFFLPHTIVVVRLAGTTIMGLAQNIQITRRRSMVLHYVGNNDWRFT